MLTYVEQGVSDLINIVLEFLFNHWLIEGVDNLQHVYTLGRF
jgi:hypothetical protein